MTAPEPAAGLRVWHRVCGAINDTALVPVLASLDRHGIVSLLAAARAPVSSAELARRSGARPGMLQLAFRLLEVSGLAGRSGRFGSGDVAVRATPAGSALLASAGAFAQAGLCQRAALEFLADPSAPIPAVPLTGNDRIDTMLAAPLLTAAMARLYRTGAFAGPLRAQLPDAASRRRELMVLASVGWASDDGLALTADGRLAASMAAQFLYPAGYLPLFARADEIIFGSGPVSLGRDEAGTEEHVDRDVDIAFSGLVFSRTCRDPLFSVALPLFDAEPLDAQPVAVVDTGAGDGTLLKELWHAIVDRSRRGAALDRYPLLMVAVEYNEIARATAARELAAAGVPHLAIAGDIGDPDAIAARLAGAGIDMAKALHVNKSVIHNRTVAAPSGAIDEDPTMAASRAVHVDQDGTLMTAAAMAAELVDFFRRWRAWTRRHGMIAIESHLAAPSLVAAAGDRTPIPALEASHGLSLQHLVEIEFHRRAAALAGYRTLAARDLQGSLLGRPLMSCDHLLPA